MEAQKKIKIIGTGVGKINLNEQLMDYINKADVIVGGKRIVSGFDKEKIIINKDIDSVLNKIKIEYKNGKHIIVLADGDPLLFGIGKRIIKDFGNECVEVYPNISVVQVVCARLGIALEDIKIISIHSKKEPFYLLSYLMNYDLIGIYTSDKEGPKYIAQQLIKRQIDSFSITVLEDLGTETEKIKEFEKIEDVMNYEFSDLNFVVLKRTSQKPFITVGMDDDFYLHEKGLITKKEIRAVSISRLCLREDSIIWDVGAGCGSVGIECSLIARKGRIFCIEKNKKRFAMIKENIKKSAAYIVEPVYGIAPDCFKELPSPDRVFIGGGLLKDINVLKKAVESIKKKGIIVLNITLIETLSKAIDFFKSIGWKYDVTQVMISRSAFIRDNMFFNPINPVFILRAEKR